MAYRTKIAAVYLLSFALDLVNMFAVSIAYPQIGVDLQASVSQLAWIGNAYMLGLTLIILPSVWLAAVVGEKRLLLISLGVFTTATWGVAQATSIETLIGWRLLQGLGGGLLIPVGQAMVYREFRPHERARLTSVILLVALMVPALSPVLGGWVVEATSWRWVFYANLPLALIALILTQCWVRPVTQSARPAPVRLATLAHLLKSPLLRVAMLTYLCIPGIFIGTQLVSILYVHQLGYGPAQTGALMLPWALAAGLAIGLTRRRFNRWGPKSLLLAGMAIQAGGLLWLARSGEGSGFWQLAGAYATMGFGGSLCSSAAQGMALLDVPAARMGHASALWNINRQLAFCLGMAVLGGLLNLLQERADPAAFVHCFLFAAAFTLLPLPWVRRIDSAGVRALVQT